MTPVSFIVAGGILGIAVGATVGAGLGYKCGVAAGWHLVARIHRRSLTTP